MRTLALLSLVLYTRLDDTSLRRQRIRSGVLEELRKAPGARIAALAQTLGCDYKTAVYHVRMLERAGLVTVERIGRTTLCYLTPRAEGEEGLS